MLVFTDSSVLVRAYMPDEVDHELAYRLVFEPAAGVSVAASVLARVEVTAAVRRAARSRRLTPDDAKALDLQVAADLGGAGPVLVVRSELSALATRARELVRRHRLRSLDALHLAAAEIDGRRIAGTDGLLFQTMDHDQHDVAVTLGLA